MGTQVDNCYIISLNAPSPSGSRHRTLTPAYVVGSNPTGAVYKI